MTGLLDGLEAEEEVVQVLTWEQSFLANDGKLRSYESR